MGFISSLSSKLFRVFAAFVLVAVQAVAYVDLTTLGADAATSGTSSITIEKNTIPDADQAFSFSTVGLSTDVTGFSLTDDSTVGLPQQVFSDLAAGAYTVSEDELLGWAVDSITCNNGASIEKTDRSVTITLGDDEDVTCTFTNRPAKVTLAAPAQPFVRITYLCQADFTGNALAWTGSQNEEVPVTAGDHIWRFRYESNNSDPNPPASVNYSTNFLSMTGDLNVDEVELQTTSSGANGVNVSTTPGPNKYGGTASVSGAKCEEADPEDRPFVRITYICQADFTGTALAWTGSQNEEVPVSNGDHIWRFRYEGNNSEANAPATVAYSTNFLGMGGDIDKDEILFEVTANGANGVNVSTTPPANLYGGTASVSGAKCENADPMDQPFVRITYLCQAEFTGNALAWNGSNNELVPVTAGDHIWRIRYEGNNSEVNAPATVPYNTNFLGMSGNIDENEIIFETTASGANGVKVLTTPQNLYNGTASVSGAKCDEAAAYVTVTKIECINDGLLPKWGTGGPNITSTTATDWVAQNDGCYFANDWFFEYAFDKPNPGDNIANGGANWTEVGPTDVNGEVTVKITDPNLEDVNKLWFREVFKPGYLEFTYNLNGKTNVDDVSAEMYCHNDVLNYDNYDFILKPEFQQHYYCAAWNVALVKITATKYKDLNQNGTRDGAGEPRLNGWEMTVYRIGDNGREVVASGVTGDDGQGKVVFDNLVPDTYYVCETLKSGWEQTEPGNDSCIKRVLNGGAETVTRFGNIQYGRLKVNKIVRNDNGGTAGPTQFGIKVDGESYRFNQQGMIGVALLPGKYSVEEIDYPGYEQVRSSCDEVVVRPGQTTECTIVNDDIPPKVIVKKRTIPRFSSDEFDFSIRNNGEVYDEFVLDGDDNSMYMTGDDFQAGSARVREFVPEGWRLIYANCRVVDGRESYTDNNEVLLELNHLIRGERVSPPRFDVEIGKTYVCGFTNREFGEVIVTKFDDQNQDGVWDEGEPTLEGWDITLTREHRCQYDEVELRSVQIVDLENDCEEEGSKVRTQTTDENGEAVFDNVRPGKYTVDEILQEGWEQTGIYCDPVKDELEFRSELLLDEYDGEYEQEGNMVRVRPGQTRYCYVGNYEIPVIEVSAVATCGNNFPYLQWNVVTNFTPTQFTLEWFTVDGNEAGDPAGILVDTQTFAPSDSEVSFDSVTNTYSATTLWPGANDDPNNPDWPGFRLENGVWVKDPSDFGGNLRPNAEVVFTVNPTAETTVSYPSEGQNCDPPSGRVLGANTLQSTGSDNTFALYAGLTIALLAVGLQRKKAEAVNR